MDAKETRRIVFLNVLIFMSSTAFGIFGSALHFIDDDSLPFWAKVGSGAMSRSHMRVLSEALDEYYIRHCALPKDQSEFILFCMSQANAEFTEDVLSTEDSQGKPLEYRSWIENGLAHYSISYGGYPAIDEESLTLTGPIVNDFPSNFDDSTCRNRVGNFVYHPTNHTPN